MTNFMYGLNVDDLSRAPDQNASDDHKIILNAMRELHAQNAVLTFKLECVEAANRDVCRINSDLLKLKGELQWRLDVEAVKAARFELPTIYQQPHLWEVLFR